MVTVSMVGDLGVYVLMVECVLGVLLMIKLVTRLTTDGTMVEGLGRGQERRGVIGTTSSIGWEGESVERVRFLARFFCGQALRYVTQDLCSYIGATYR